MDDKKILTEAEECAENAEYIKILVDLTEALNKFGSNESEVNDG